MTSPEGLRPRSTRPRANQTRTAQPRTIRTAPRDQADSAFANGQPFWQFVLDAGALTVLLGLSIQMFVVYSASIRLLSRMSPLEFFRRIKTVMLTAFSTSSSNATLPTALRVSEQNLACRRRSTRSGWPWRPR